MLALIACFLATQVPIDQPPRLRTVLPNGAAILVEKVPNAKSISIELLASSRGTEETPSTNGLRHLLEHLIAKGPKRDLDQTLETAGGFLRAETLRDTMQFAITVPNSQFKLGMNVVTQLMQMPQLSQGDIEREARIIQQEAALQEDEMRLSAAAWAVAYRDNGLEVTGNFDLLKNATPAMLDKLHHIQFSGGNVAVVVVGDVDLDAATKACADILSKVPKLNLPKIDRGKPSGGSTSSAAAGEVIGVPVRGWRSPETAAKVAAAFAVASEVDGSFVIYTPSAGPGLLLVGRNSQSSGLETVLSKANVDYLFILGRAIAKNWIQSQLQTPAGIAEARGQLLVQEVDLKPETMLENLDTMTLEKFSAALSAFRSEEALRVVGK